MISPIKGKKKVSQNKWLVPCLVALWKSEWLWWQSPLGGRLTRQVDLYVANYCNILINII